MKRHNLAWGLAISGLLFLTASCSSGSSELSETQQAFLGVRGNPQLFQIGFVTVGLDAEGKQVPLDDSRRIETWGYLGGVNKMVVFDGGFFVREDPTQGTITVPQTALNPGSFSAGMTLADVGKLLGTSTNTETVQLVGQFLNVLHYGATATEPPISVGFLGDRLVSVVVGYTMTLNIQGGA